jgi:hypothetical protein
MRGSSLQTIAFIGLTASREGKSISHNHVDLCYMRDTYTWKTRRLSVRDKPTLLSEKMLFMDYDRKGSVVKKITGREPLGAWRQGELIGCKPPVVK